MFGLVKKKYYDEVMATNEKALKLCKDQQLMITTQKHKIEELERELYKAKILNKNLQAMLKAYRQENLDLKKKPLENVRDLIDHI
jgi:hypothetical protein